ncbi:unnamed protein product [Urochloa humidicola]
MNVLWEAFRVGRRGSEAILRNGSNRKYYLNFIGDRVSGSTQWVVEPIHSIQHPPVFPSRTLIHSRMKRLVTVSRQNKYIADTKMVFEFEGRSCSDLRDTIAKRVNKEVACNVTLCICGGALGRLTPLITDLPDSEDPISVVVLTTGSADAMALVYPNVSAAQ